MRELNDCMAEVFRRSEARITQRRQKQKRALTWCVPLVLCVTLAAAAIPATTQPTPPDSVAAPESGDVVCPYTQACIRSRAMPEARVFDDPDQVLALYEAITAITDAAEPESTEDALLPPDMFDESVEAEDQDQSSNVSMNRHLPYTLTLTDDAGNSVSYTLKGATLVADNTGVAYPLDNEQQTTLLIALGVITP